MEVFAEYLVRGVFLGVTYSLVALPISLLFATTGSVDMAVGAYAVLAAAIAVIVGGPFGILCGIVAALIASAFVAGIALRMNRPGKTDPLTVVLGTFGCAIFLESLVLTRYGKDAIVLHPFESFWSLAGIHVSPQAAINIAVSLVTLAVLVLVLTRTPAGLSMRASSVNPFGALLAGIPVKSIWFATYLIGGLLAGIGGILIMYTTGLSYNSGITLTITSFGAAILLGLGNPLHAFAGGVLFGTIQALSAGYLPGAWPTAMPFIFIFLVLSFGKVNRAGIAGGRA